MWSLDFLYCKLAEEAPLPIIATSPNLFLLVNLIIFLILISLHAQQRHAASASRKATKKRRIAELAAAEWREVDRIKSLQPFLQNEPSLLIASTETEVQGAAAPQYAVLGQSGDETAVKNFVLEASMAVSSSDFISGTAMSTALQGTMEGSSSNEEFADVAASSAGSMETLPLQDGNAIVAHGSEPCWTVDQDGRPAATVETIVLEEDGRLTLIEVPEGPDAARQEDANSSHKRDPHSSCPQNSNRNCVSNSSIDLATKKSKGNLVPKSISLNGDHLITCDPHSTVSRSRVKSMDATNDNTFGCWQSHTGNNNVVKRARSKGQPSIISQDELNARVESFIATFNEKMKIQRQQSLLSYMEMVDRGA